MAAASLDLLTDLVRRARAAGADAADAVWIDSTALSHERRLGQLEKMERQESGEVGLRAFVGRRQAIASSADLGSAALAELVERAVAMARAVPEDPYCGLAEAHETCAAVPALELEEAAEPAPEALAERAARAEDAARSITGVSNSEGAEASWSRTRVALAASNGFAASYAVSRHSVSVAVVAGEGLGMERDYDYSTAAFAADLETPEQVGRRAGERAVRRLGARKPPTQRVPVVYEWRMAGGLLRHLAGAINGAAIARGTSFLKDRMGEAIFGPDISIVDDPLRQRGLGSRPFDGEGIATARRAIVEAGRLTTWLLDLRSARQLRLHSTGHAARGTSSPPSPAPSNFYMLPGQRSPQELIGDIRAGLFVTDMMGMGVNIITGDYSRGASGFWIENGEIAHPVNEVTIAGNLKDMFRTATPADDLKLRGGIDAPTIRVEGMTVAGR